MPVRWWLKVAGIVLGAMFVALIIVSMFATELTRVFVEREAEPPITLPHGVDIRYSDRLASLIGRGTPSGRATAVTLGYVIVVPTRFDRLSLPERARIIRHELVHVQQRRSYGRHYLPMYGLLYVVRGYTNHPFEREAAR
jgi:beta-lactamase regulating signal transducer with metallopeptidase domain